MHHESGLMSPAERANPEQPASNGHGRLRAARTSFSPNLRTLTRATDRLLEVLIVACLVGMVLLVFLNVVLRYAFNSGIGVSDEVARILFVWLTFLGAILGLRRRQHVGVTMLRDALSARVRWIPDAACEALIVICSVLLLQGAWKFALLNHDNLAPATGMPMSFVYGLSGITALAFILISGTRLIRSLRMGGQASTARAGQAPLDFE